MSDGSAKTRAETRRPFFAALSAVLLGGFTLRVAYVLFQRGSDPTFSRPILDGAYYLDWARSLVDGGGTDGAYYLAPLYPYVLAVLLSFVGERWTLLLIVQQATIVAAAAAVGIAGRRVIGAASSIAAVVLLLLYHPLLFFSSKPLAEPVALALLLAAVVAGWNDDRRSEAGAGFLAGLATLARPNFLLVPAAWCAEAVVRRRWGRVAAIAGATGLALVPVLARNWVASGHAVPVSSNAGITLYHGNGPGARGVYTPPNGFSGSVERQRDEATALASRAAGRDLDPVAADRWWGRAALGTRLLRPADSVRLVASRFALLLDNAEIGLDYDPVLDPNPARPTLRLGLGREFGLPSFGMLIGLAAAGLYLGGVRRTGGWTVWGAIAACAVTPMLFYVSSRYRLPVGVLMCIPAGVGLAGLLGFRSTGLREARRTAWLVAAAVFALSLAVPAWSSPFVPYAEMRRAVLAQGMSARAMAWADAGRFDLAEPEARAAAALAPGEAGVTVGLGRVLESRGDLAGAEASYLRAIELAPPGRGAAAARLSALLVRRGMAPEAVPVLRRALEWEPANEACWNNLVVALFASGDRDGARSEVARARERGIRLEPGLADAVSSAVGDEQ